MIDKKFRRLMLDLPEVVRASILGDREIEIAKLVHRLPTPIYSRDIADILNISVQNASTQLNRLVTAGYASRHKVTAQSGGIEYQYLPTLN